MTKLYNKLPYSLKQFYLFFAASYKKQQKYGPYFEKYYSYLLNSGIDNQVNKAKEELSAFLETIRNNNKINCIYNIDKNLDIYEAPIIEKKDVIRNYDNILSQKPFIYNKSSGTSGQPIKVPYTKEVYQKEYSFWWYHRSISGIKRGDKIATFAGHQVKSFNDNKAPFGIMNYAENQLFFSSYHLSQKNLNDYISQLNRFKPSFIHGYPSSIYIIAKYIITNDIKLEFMPKMIVTSSETTLTYQRRAIEKAFNCKCFVWYGNTELCGHITECIHGKLHVQPYHSFVRFVNNKQKDISLGQEGYIVSTNFTNLAFPLINYNTKDLVRLSSNQNCKCDSGGTIVDYIIGRIEDYLITNDGRLIGRLDHLFKDAKFIRNAQIEQIDRLNIIIRIEQEEGYNTNIEKTILDEARSRLGDEMNIHFDYCNEIPKKKSGKFEFVIQRLNINELVET